MPDLLCGCIVGPKAHGPSPATTIGEWPVRVAALCASKRIEGRCSKPLEIAQVTRHHREIVNERGRRYQRVLDQMSRLPMHQLGPSAKDDAINRQDRICGGDDIDPRFYLFCFCRILSAGDLDTGLQLTECYRG